MIELFTWPTPNGQKVQILLEELGTPYIATPVNILRGEQFEPAFLSISPNGKIPAITDDAVMVAGRPLAVFETGAILLYLAEKNDAFLPRDTARRAEATGWHLFQSASLGPMLGQATHFRRYAKEEVAYAVDRYTREASRLYGVLEQRLQHSEWLGGDAYSIADMGAFPWICRHRRQGQAIEDFPAVKAWMERVSARPAVQRGMDVLKEVARETSLDDAAHKQLFGRADAPATAGEGR